MSVTATESPDLTITSFELAERLDITPQSIRSMTTRGTAPKRISKRNETPIIYKLSAVEEWLLSKGKRFYRKWHGQEFGSTRHLVPERLLEDYDKMAQLIDPWQHKVQVQEEPLQGWESGCWVWIGFFLDGVYPKYKARSVRSTVFETAFPDAHFNMLTAKCGTHGCVNPDHLVDEVAAFWEDLSFLLDHGARTKTIEIRLGFKRNDLRRKHRSGRSPVWQAIADRFSRRADIESGTYDFQSEKERLAQAGLRSDERLAA